MRSENSLLEDENADGLDFEELQRDQIHLEKVKFESRCSVISPIRLLSLSIKHDTFMQ